MEFAVSKGTPMAPAGERASIDPAVRKDSGKKKSVHRRCRLCGGEENWTAIRALALTLARPSSVPDLDRPASDQRTRPKRGAAFHPGEPVCPGWRSKSTDRPNRFWVNTKPQGRWGDRRSEIPTTFPKLTTTFASTICGPAAYASHSCAKAVRSRTGHRLPPRIRKDIRRPSRSEPKERFAD